MRLTISLLHIVRDKAVAKGQADGPSDLRILFSRVTDHELVAYTGIQPRTIEVMQVGPSLPPLFLPLHISADASTKLMLKHLLELWPSGPSSAGSEPHIFGG